MMAQVQDQATRGKNNTGEGDRDARAVDGEGLAKKRRKWSDWKSGSQAGEEHEPTREKWITIAIALLQYTQ